MLLITTRRACFLCLTCIAALTLCSPPGPTRLDESILERARPASLLGSFRIDGARPLYRNLQRGEVFFEQSPDKARTYFYFRILGLERMTGIRIRQYEGLAYEVDGRLLLQSERCYEFGKRLWIDRLKPVERWDCTHLIFVYEKSGNRWISTETEQTERSEWFNAEQDSGGQESHHGRHSLSPMPLARHPAVFAGQIIPLNDRIRRPLPAPVPPEQTRPDPDVRSRFTDEEWEAFQEEARKRERDERVLREADVIVWGYEGATNLRRAQELEVTDENGNVLGRLTVTLRPGHFILCRWAGPAPDVDLERLVAASHVRHGGGGFL